MKNINSINQLLSNVGGLVKEAQKKAEENFEHFNIFSILNLESKENKTHSAFIAYLLDARANHRQGSKFLTAFLSIVNANFLDLENTSVRTEIHIGYKEENDQINGRIDILLWDKNDNLIVIENKIYAKDMDKQLCRYYNYCKRNDQKKFKVFYLNLFGNLPDKISSLNLIVAEEYHIISYKYHIISWLNECQEIVKDIPILYQTIKQYKLLVYKLTNTMTQEKELIKEMLDNFEAAQFINDNFNKAKEEIADDIRDKLIEFLRKEIAKKFNIIKGRNIAHPNAQIEVFYNGIEGSRLYFGIDSFSPNSFSDSVDYGIYYNSTQFPTTYFLDGNKENKHSEDPSWPYYMSFASYNDLEIRFDKPDIFLAWHKDENDFRKGLIEYLGKEFNCFLQKHENGLEEFLIKEK